MHNRKVYILEAFRSPFAKLYGGFTHWRADDMLSQFIQRVLKQSSKIIPEKIEQVFMGCANQAGEDSRNIARQGVLLAGLSSSITGVTINSLCTSGMDAIQMAAYSVAMGETDLCLAGAVDNMSRSPFILNRQTKEQVDSTIGWRFINPKLYQYYQPYSMAETAELLANSQKISRTQQDEYAFRSREAYETALRTGFYDTILLSLDKDLIQDEQHRLMSMDMLANFPPMLRGGANVTLGNSARIGDGVVLLAIASEDYIKKHRFRPLVRIKASARAAVHPDQMGLAPLAASQKVLKRLNLNIYQMHQIELSEAFAVQTLAFIHTWKVPMVLVNPNGGEISTGKPLSVSSATLVLNLAKAMQRKNSIRYGLATACAGLGLGTAMVLEAV